MLIFPLSLEAVIVTVLVPISLILGVPVNVNVLSVEAAVSQLGTPSLVHVIAFP